MTPRTRRLSRLRVGIAWLSIGVAMLPASLGGALHALHHGGAHEDRALAICATGCGDSDHDHDAAHHHVCAQCAAARAVPPNLAPEGVRIWTPPVPSVVLGSNVPQPRSHSSTLTPARAPPVCA